MRDSNIMLWASLCEKKTVDEAYEKPYAYDVADERKPIATVKDLKEVLSHFKDNDELKIIGEGDTTYSIKAMWNANMEYVMTDNDVGDDVCFIRVSED